MWYFLLNFGVGIWFGFQTKNREKKEKNNREKIEKKKQKRKKVI